MLTNEPTPYLLSSLCKSFVYLYKSYDLGYIDKTHKTQKRLVQIACFFYSNKDASFFGTVIA